MDKLEKAMAQAKANMELSGFVITDEHDKLIRSRLKNEITEEQFQKKAIELSKKKRV